MRVVEKDRIHPMIGEKGRRCLFAGASYHAAIIGENVHTLVALVVTTY